MLKTLAITGALAIALVPDSAAAQLGGAAGGDGRVLVMPFDLDTREASAYWLGEGVSLLVTDALVALGVPIVPRDAREEALDALRLPSGARFARATTVRIAQAVGASRVVFGTVSVADGRLGIAARVMDLEAGTLGPVVTDAGQLGELRAVCSRTGRRLAGDVGEAGAGPMAGVNLEVFELFVKGLMADAHETRVRLLAQAVSRDPRFEDARLALWDAYTEAGDHTEALKAIAAVAGGLPLSREARFRRALSLVELRRYDEAFADLEALAAERKVPAVLNNLGVVQIRRGATHETGRATYFLTAAAELAPNDTDVLFNLGYAYWLERDARGAVYWLREAVRRDTTDAEAHYVLSAALQTIGAAPEATRERELAARLDASFEDAREGAPASGLERVKPSLDDEGAGQASMPAHTASEQEQADLVRFYLSRARGLAEQGRARDAVVDVKRVLYVSPYHADALLLLGRLLLSLGQPGEAADAFRIGLWSRETAAGHVGLGEALLARGDAAAARAEAERALALEPGSADARRLLSRASAR